jgi:hypothetical protein
MPATRFQDASVSKPVTAWGLLCLVEQGRIGLDEPVVGYLRRRRPRRRRPQATASPSVACSATLPDCRSTAMPARPWTGRCHRSMAKLRPPIVPEQPVPVVPEDDLRRLLATCAGKIFEDRRDQPDQLLAVVRLLQHPASQSVGDDSGRPREPQG